MAAPTAPDEILEVNRRYHDVAAEDYDAKWGISFGEIGRRQVLGKVTKLLGERPSFGSLRELTRVVGNDCAIEIDTNSYSVPWRLIGERVAVTVAAGKVHIRHGVREVAVHKQSEGRRLRIVDSAHLDGVAGRNGAICRRQIAAATVPGSPQPPSLLRPLAEYEAAIGGSF